MGWNLSRMGGTGHAIQMKFASIIIISIIHCFSIKAQTLNVGRSGEFKSVREAIETAKAGDTIVIHTGIYREGNILIKKSLTIKGEGTPVLDGEDRAQPRATPLASRPGTGLAALERDSS